MTGTFSEAASIACALSLMLTPCALSGLALINAGLGRSRNAAHSMMASMCAVAVAAAVYMICGFSWQGVAGGPAFALQLGSTSWNWIGAEPWFLRGIDWTNSASGLTGGLAAWAGMSGAALAALIPIGAGGERWRLASISASTALLTAWTYPLFAHWAWGGGWLGALGASFGLGRGFVDVGGAGAIHVTGGLTALSMAWILGPRRSKFSAEGMPSAIPAHNAVFILFGCGLALVGWTGLNMAGAILFAQVDLGRLPLVGIDTLLSAGAAALGSAMMTRTRFGKPDASLSANGWVGGLVASSASCAFLPPVAALVIGLVAGGLTTLSVEWLELRLRIDDPGGAISVHAVSGDCGGCWRSASSIIFRDRAAAASGWRNWWASRH